MVTLNLTDKQAKYLFIILNHVGGDSVPRREMDKVLKKLNDTVACDLTDVNIKVIGYEGVATNVHALAPNNPPALYIEDNAPATTKNRGCFYADYEDNA